MAVQKIITATLVGINAALVEVEADVSNGLPSTIIVGLPDTAIQESRERVRSAIKHSGFVYPQTRVSLNLAPGSLPKIGSHFDLPIAIAIMLAGGLFRGKPAELLSSLFVGELSLDGGVRSTAGILAMVQAARDYGYKGVFIPKDSVAIASLVTGIAIYPVYNLLELAEHISGRKHIEPINNSTVPAPEMNSSTYGIYNVDFAEIAGQHQAKRALEIVAAGGHNILMTGPPGSGKTMLAKSVPGILPPLSSEEILALTKIYNSIGKVQTEIVSIRPFRSPHHTSSSAALIGGGGIPKPGEVTLAHHGVLFLDELPEFSRNVLEVLRQPLEEHSITVTRSRYAYTFPASFILIAAQNPCPCGNFGQAVDKKKLECDCHPTMIEKYRKKISGPLLDRIDLHLDVPRLSYDEMSGSENSGLQQTVSERSSEIQHRVTQARLLQTRRSGAVRTNSEMTVKELKRYCRLNLECSNLLRQAVDRYQLSGRTIHRVQKVARTIADLAGSENIELSHLAESLQYRLREHARA